MSFEVDAGTAQAAYNCTTGVWNPSYLDGNVALNRQAGAQTQLIVDYFPPCLKDQSVSMPTDKKWEQLVLSMAEHEISTEGVTVFEVWNEPSFSMPLAGKNGYLELYKDTATELEKAAAAEHVHIEVGGPGNDDLGQIDNAWIVALANYAVKHRLPLDFVSWHMYANDPDEGPQQNIPFGVCDTGPPVGGQPCWYNPSLDVSLYARSGSRCGAHWPSSPRSTHCCGSMSGGSTRGTTPASTDPTVPPSSPPHWPVRSRVASTA